MADPTEPATPGMAGALSQVAYGSAGNPMAQLPELLKEMVPRSGDTDAESLSFWGGFGKPNTTGQLSGALGNAMEAQSATRLERDKLRAQYVPLIMQSLVQGQQMSVAAANAGRDFLKDVNPKLDTHLAAMRTDNAEPVYGDVMNRVMQLGEEYQIPPHILHARLKSIPKDPEELRTYLDRLASAQAGADKMVPGAATDAAGRQVRVNPNKGTTAVLGSGDQPKGGKAGAGTGAAAGATENNPTSSQVDWEKNTRGDVKGYEEGLRGRADAFAQMMARMNEQAKYVDTFQPGRYAGVVGGLAAAIKDIGTRLPGINPKAVEDLANKLVNAPPGSTQAVAASQLFKQLAQQETLAQLKTALGEGQRLNQSEYQNFSKANLGEAMDPESFKGLRDFFFKQASDSANKYSHWADYVADPEVKKPSVTGFDARFTRKAIDHYLTGSTDVVPTGKKGDAKPNYPEAKPAAAAGAVVPAKAGEKIDLSLYEPGAKAGPTGKVYVIENGTARPAKSRAAAGKLE